MPPKIVRQNPQPKRVLTSQFSTNNRDGWNLIDKVRILVYGESGVGKTTFASSFPDPLLWLICSGGSMPGELRSIDTPENRQRITARVVSTIEEFESDLEDATNFATIVLDHATGFMDLRLKELLGLPELPAQKGWGMATQQQYAQLALQCKESFRALLNKPCNVVIIAQQRTFGGKDDGMDPELIKPTVGAALTPSLTGWLNPACDMVVQCFIRPRYVIKSSTIGGKVAETKVRAKGVEYCLRTEAHEIYQVKFRTPNRLHNSPECIVDPTYAKMIEIVKG